MIRLIKTVDEAALANRHGFAESDWDQLRKVSDCDDRRLSSLITKVEEAAALWLTRHLERKMTWIDAEGVSALESLADAMNSLRKSKSAAAFSSVLSVISPHWDKSDPFYFSSGEEHSATYPAELLSEIKSILAVKRGRVPKDDEIDAQAIDGLLKIWFQYTNMTPSKTTKNKCGNTELFFKILLPGITIKKPPLPGRPRRESLRTAREWEPPSFSEACLPGIRRGIDRWQGSRSGLRTQL